jgi:hypothetical protein
MLIKILVRLFNSVCGLTYGMIAGGVGAPPSPKTGAVMFPSVTFPPVTFSSCANAGVVIVVSTAKVTNMVAVRVAAATKIVAIPILLSGFIM